MSGVTICLHTAFKDIMEQQIYALRPLEDVLNISWNNRFYRHPEAYDSYSEMVNHSVVTSNDEYIIMINDRTVPKPPQVLKILALLYSGYSVATIFRFGFVGYTKEFFRKFGFWDQRFYGGGYDDVDFVLRLKLANMSYYESEEGEYNTSLYMSVHPKNGFACERSRPFFNTKWQITDTEVKRLLPEEDYDYAKYLGPGRPDISDKWLNWDYTRSEPNVGCSMLDSFMKHPTIPNKHEYTKKVTSV